MVGIFDCWEFLEGGDVLYFYIIIIVDFCKGLSDIYYRMFVILDGEEVVFKWFDFGEVLIQEVLKLIYLIENIIFYVVFFVVNNL